MRMATALLLVLIVAGFAAFMALGPALTQPFGAAQEAPAVAEPAPPTDTPSASGYPTAVARQDVILRAAPDPSAPTTGLIYAGSAIPLRGCSGDGLWCETAEGSWVTTHMLDGVPAALRPTASATQAEPATPPAEPPVQTEPAAVSLLGLLPTPTAVSQDEPTATVPTLAPTQTGPRAADAANLRGGPGTTYPVVGGVTAGQALAVTGQSVAGDWYQLADGAWIAAFLVEDAPAGVAVVPAPPITEITESAQIPYTENGIQVDFINPHYNCVQGEFTYRTGDVLWGYRMFQIDMFIVNNSSEAVMAPWQPTRWVITDGVTEEISDLFWQWTFVPDTGLYPQPTINSGQSAGWTFVAFPVDRNQWVSAVEFEYRGKLYRQAFNLGPYGNSHNYMDCNEPRPHTDRPTPTPHPLES